MQQIIAYFIASWLFVTLLLTGASANKESFLKRDEKRNMNLLGKEVINYIYTDNSGLVRVNELKCVEGITRLPGADNVAGMIFIYDDFIIGVDKNCNIIGELQFNDILDISKVSYVNRLVNKIVSERENAAWIEIVYEGVDDYFFNDLGKGITVFLLAQNETYLSVSGYTIA